MRSVFNLLYAPALLILMCQNTASQSSYKADNVLQSQETTVNQSALTLQDKHPLSTAHNNLNLDIQDPAEFKSDVDYLVLFPNPVRDNLFLRFVLNRTLDITCLVYDTSGRHLKSELFPQLPSGEHDIKFDLKPWEKGIYLLRFDAGNASFIRKLIVL